MKRALINIALIVFTGLSIACRKDEAPAEQAIRNLMLIDEDDLGPAVGAVAGKDVLLLIYSDIRNLIHFKLTDQNGNEFWTKTYGLKIVPESGLGVADFNVVADSDTSFALFHQGDLIRINYEGDELSRQTEFYSLGNVQDTRIVDVVITSDDHYLMFGQFSLSGNRAFVAEYDRSGQRRFLTPFTVNVTYAYNEITGAIALPGGGYFLAGTAAPGDLVRPTQLFFLTIDAAGKLQSSIVHGFDSLDLRGSDLIKMKDGNYGYLLSPADNGTNDGRARFLTVDPSGNIIGTTFIDLARDNFGGGTSPYCGSGLTLRNDGTLVGVMNSDIEYIEKFLLGITGNFQNPHFSYVFKLKATGELSSQQFFNRNYSNYYNSVTTLNDGRVMIFGTTLGFGERQQLVCIWL